MCQSSITEKVWVHISSISCWSWLDASMNFVQDTGRLSLHNFQYSSFFNHIEKHAVNHRTLYTIDWQFHQSHRDRWTVFSAFLFFHLILVPHKIAPITISTKAVNEFMNCRERQIYVAFEKRYQHKLWLFYVDTHTHTRYKVNRLSVDFIQDFIYRINDHYEYLIESVMHHHECQQFRQQYSTSLECAV